MKKAVSIFGFGVLLFLLFSCASANTLTASRNSTLDGIWFWYDANDNAFLRVNINGSEVILELYILDDSEYTLEPSYIDDGLKIARIAKGTIMVTGDLIEGQLTHIWGEWASGGMGNSWIPAKNYLLQNEIFEDDERTYNILASLIGNYIQGQWEDKRFFFVRE